MLFIGMNEESDIRYAIIKPLIDGGQIKSFNDIFKMIPKSVVAGDLGKNKARFSDLLADIEGFTIKELFMIAKLCHLTESEILQLAHAEYLKQKGGIENNNK